MRKRIRALAALLLAGWLAAPAIAQAQHDENDALRDAREGLILAEDFAAALSPAERAVAAAEASADRRLPHDLTRLARVQSGLEMHAEAELTNLRAVELVKQAGGNLSPDLIGPYRALGRAYIRARNFPAAVTVLEEARHISHREWGPFNLEQTELIEDLTTALLGLGDTARARELQQRRLENAVRRYGADDPRVIPFHYHLADYYDRSRLRASAREQYAAALAIAERRFGRTDARLLEPLREMMRMDLTLGRRDPAPAERVREILAVDDRVAPEERGPTLAALGDWALVGGDPAGARELYALAFGAIAVHDEAAAEAAFAAPVMLDFTPPLSEVDRATRSRRPVAWGEIVLRFDLSADGRVSHVRTARLTPPNRIESDYVRRLRQAHFRPALVAGSPVPTTDVELTHAFRYYADPDD